MDCRRATGSGSPTVDAEELAAPVGDIIPADFLRAVTRRRDGAEDVLTSLAERILDLALVRPTRRIGLLQKTLRHVVQQAPLHPGSAYLHRAKYDELRAIFLKNGEGSKYDRAVRAGILERFEEIDRSVKILSTPSDGLFLAEALLSLGCEGAIVECGCFNGGSTAKLSIVARITGRELVVFDSFEGLPDSTTAESRDLHVRHGSAWLNAWTPGRYAARLDAVRGNVERYGEISVCRFVKGWFADTLTEANLPSPIALAFTDVDVASSVRDCLLALWPKLAHGAIFFSHDIAFVKVLQVFFNDQIWHELLQEPMPILFGAGYGLCDASPHLGYMVKGRGLTPEYLKHLTLDK